MEFDLSENWKLATLAFTEWILFPTSHITLQVNKGQGLQQCRAALCDISQEEDIGPEGI